MKRIQRFFHQYQHGLWILVYMAFYLVGFSIVEHAGHRHYHIIHSVIDDMIPFNEYFIIPYMLWFIYLTVGVCWFIFFCKNRREYYKLVSVLAIGMTIFLIVSCVFPNKQDLRPEVFVHENVFTQMVGWLYRTDTPTNILPSIHVFNSLVMFFALNRTQQLKPYRLVRFLAGLLSVSIVLSTMFLKQHSVVDVSLGTLMSAAVQMFCDRVFSDAPETAREKYRRGLQQRI